MPERGAEPRALFLFPDEPPQPDTQVCSGRYRDWLGGETCPYSEDGRMPWPESGERTRQPGGSGQQEGSPESEAAHQEAEPGYPCVTARLGRLSDWRAERGLQFPPELGDRLLLKCKQMFLLVLTIGWEGGPEGEAR